MSAPPPFVTFGARKANHDGGFVHDGAGMYCAESPYGSAADSIAATHDVSRVSYHVKHLDSFVQTLQESANRAFPNRGRSSQRYSKVQALLVHWKCDDLFVLPELEDLEKCMREDYGFETNVFPIPSENSHLELMLKVGDMIKKHESEDTLFLVYYGGHARIDESRQSTWCATRHLSSPWLQWSAIQTLLERSASDVLILLDCCAGAASATFPNGKSITETISASSWDAIAPDPGRYSFTNAVIEVLQEWRLRIFSAAMLHAEVLARLKHPRPILINGRHFEARSTPVHFMMTSNHKAPSIELGRIVLEKRLPPTPRKDAPMHASPSMALRTVPGVGGGRLVAEDSWGPTPHLDPLGAVARVTDPNEDEPHVMISLALEDDQRLDVQAWEQWLATFPALAKHVKIQGVFKSHSNLLLLSLPVMVWDLLPEDPACSFIAFIRSNNLLNKQAATSATAQAAEPEMPRADAESFYSGTTFTPAEDCSSSVGRGLRTPTQQPFRGLAPPQHLQTQAGASGARLDLLRSAPTSRLAPTRTAGSRTPLRHAASAANLSTLTRQTTAPASLPGDSIARTVIMNQSRSSKKALFSDDQNLPERPALAKHVLKRLEDYFQKQSAPTLAVAEFLASNLGVEVADVHHWFHHRRQQEKMKHNLQNLRIDDAPPEVKDGARMILAGHLNDLLEIYPCRGVLLMDLRSSTDFEKSHMHDAVNLRAPLCFMQTMKLEHIQDTFVDDQSRRSFGKWSQSRCVVVYDRAVEYAWECPVAEALYRQFRREGWTGRCFILKGHYREFSVSFDKHVSGSRMTSEAKTHLDSLRQLPAPTAEQASDQYRRYQVWLQALGRQDRSPVADLSPLKKAQRLQAVEQHQRELEAEFETRFPALYKKMISMHPASSSTCVPNVPPPPFSAAVASFPYGYGRVPTSAPSTPLKASAFCAKSVAERHEKDDDFTPRKAQLFEALASGLDKMREAVAATTVAMGTSSAPPSGGGGYLSRTDDKYSALNAESKPLPHPGLEDDGFDEIDPKGEGLRNDPAFERAGGGETLSGGPGGADGARTSQQKKRPLWGRLRSGTFK